MELVNQLVVFGIGRLKSGEKPFHAIDCGGVIEHFNQLTTHAPHAHARVRVIPWGIFHLSFTMKSFFHPS